MVRGHISDGRRWLDTFLGSATASAKVRAKALAAAGTLSIIQGDFVRADTFLEEARTLYRETGNEVGEASILDRLSTLEARQGKFESAAAKTEEALAIFRRLGDTRNVAAMLSNLGLMQVYLKDYGQAVTNLAEGLTLRREVGDEGGVALTLAQLATAAHFQSRPAQAEVYLLEALGRFRALGDKRHIMNCLFTLAEVRASTGRDEQAVHLFGVVEVLREALRVFPSGADVTRYEATVTKLRNQLGAVVFHAIWDEGRSSSLEEVVKQLLLSSHTAVSSSQV